MLLATLTSATVTLVTTAVFAATQPKVGKLPFGDFANFQSRYPRASPRSGDRPRPLYWCSLETSLLRLHALKVDFRIQEGIIKGGANISSYIDQVILIKCVGTGECRTNI